MLAEAPGGLFHGIDLALDGDQGIAVWSDRSGAWVVPVAAGGAPRGRRVRVGPPCDGGLATARADGGFVVACLERAMDEAGKSGHVTVLRLDASLRPAGSLSFGPAGRYSRGVALAMEGEGDVPVVAWHDGTPGAHRVWLVHAAPGAEPRLVSREGLAAGAPSVALRDGQPIVAWAETWFDDDGYLVGQVLVSDLRGAPRELAVIIHDDPRPVLARDGRGPLVAYRDERPAGTRARLFVQRITDDLVGTGEPLAVGRANGTGRPHVVACEEAVTTVAPRSFGRWDVLIGLNRLGPDLGRIGIERQIYEYGVDFSLAAASCAGEHLLVLAAERGHSTRPLARLRSTTVDCR